MQTFVNSKLSFAAALFASIEVLREPIAQHQQSWPGKRSAPNRLVSQSRPAT
jgi:hypothetical protein